MNNFLWVGIGGFAGSVLRYGISALVAVLGIESKWPIATFTVNLLGSFLIGTLIGWIGRSGSMIGLYLCVIGFCGGFTTFSTFSLDVIKLLRAEQYGLGLLYVLASVVLCTAGTWCGLQLTERA